MAAVEGHQRRPDGLVGHLLGGLGIGTLDPGDGLKEHGRDAGRGAGGAGASQAGFQGWQAKVGVAGQQHVEGGQLCGAAVKRAVLGSLVGGRGLAEDAAACRLGLRHRRRPRHSRGPHGWRRPCRSRGPHGWSRLFLCLLLPLGATERQEDGDRRQGQRKAQGSEVQLR